MKPSVGRIVHYVSGGACFAAIVISVNEGNVATPVGLHVFYPPGVPETWRGPDVLTSQSEDRHDGTWHWPERVE